MMYTCTSTMIWAIIELKVLWAIKNVQKDLFNSFVSGWLTEELNRAFGKYDNPFISCCCYFVFGLGI